MSYYQKGIHNHWGPLGHANSIRSLLSGAQLGFRARAEKKCPEKTAMLRTKKKHTRIGGPPGSCARKQKHGQEKTFEWATA